VTNIKIQVGSGFLGGSYEGLNYHRIDNFNHYQWEKFYTTVASYQWTESWFKRIMLFLIFGICICNWKRFARWYYFYFYPHPARDMVREALDPNQILNGPAFAAAIGEVPPGNSIFRKVRLEQGEALVEKMQAMSRSMAAAQARATAQEYERRAAEGYEHAALHAIQEAIALAAVALERAKAAWQTSEAIRKGGRA
jgi:hypothetical protein